MKLIIRKPKSEYFALFIAALLALLLMLNSCEEDSEQFVLGEKYIDSQMELYLVDTFSVSLSTVILDEVLTADKDVLLIGSFHDTLIGDINSNSYIQIGIPDTFFVYKDDIYDSLTLVIKYNNYSFGDTIPEQKISVHQLEENIEVSDDEDLNSLTTFDYNPMPVGSIVYRPTPNKSKDSLSIKIDADLGTSLFLALQEDSTTINNNESFLEYFKGFALIADRYYPGSIIGFSGTADDVKLVLHLHRNNSSNDRYHVDFKLYETSKQFNNINHDFSTTILDPLEKQQYELSSKETKGLSFFHGGIGLAIRVDFPSLDDILFINRFKVVEASLSIAPKTGSYDEFGLPLNLSLYETDESNNQNDWILTPDGLIASGTLAADNQYHEYTRYTFDVTQYINDELEDSYIDPSKGILIMPTTDSYESNFDRLIADSKSNNTKLKIYYITY